MDRTRRRYLDGFATGCLVLLYDDLTVHEIVESLDSDRGGDWTLSPWRSGYQAAIRSAFGR
jgi:hypothetical protein